VVHDLVTERSDVPRVVVLNGPPGAGKSTALRTVLERQPGIAHFNERLYFADQRQRGTRLGAQAGDLARRFRWVPDWLMAETISGWLADELDGASGLLVEGFPRNSVQCELLDHVLAKYGLAVDLHVYLDVPDAVALARTTGRRICQPCETLVEGAIALPGEVCGRCGTGLVLRPDDAPEVLRDRLAHHRAGAGEVHDHYRRRGVLRQLSGQGTRDEVTRRLFDAVGAVGLGPAAQVRR